MTSKNIPLKFTTLKKATELFKAQESFKGSNFELYLDTRNLLESKYKKKIQSLEEADIDELLCSWIQNGYIDHNAEDTKDRKLFTQKFR